MMSELIIKLNDSVFGDGPGFFVERGLMPKTTVDDLNSYIDTLEPSVVTRCTKTPWGFGNFRENQLVLNAISKCELITLLEKSYSNFNWNHIVVNQKSAFYGPAVEWHQEMCNRDTFSPGCLLSMWSDFLQIYIALDSESVDNGGLRVVPGSHRLGYVDHQDFLSPLLTHKRTIPSVVLEAIVSECGLVNLTLEPGDAVVFNSLVVHGSGSNASNKRRRSIVMQAQLKESPWASQKFEEEVRHRKQFVLSAMGERHREIAGDTDGLYRYLARGS